MGCMSSILWFASKDLLRCITRNPLLLLSDRFPITSYFSHSDMACSSVTQKEEATNLTGQAFGHTLFQAYDFFNWIKPLISIHVIFDSLDFSFLRNPYVLL